MFGFEPQLSIGYNIGNNKILVCSGRGFNLRRYSSNIYNPWLKPLPVRRNKSELKTNLKGRRWTLLSRKNRVKKWKIELVSRWYDEEQIFEDNNLFVLVKISPSRVVLANVCYEYNMCSEKSVFCVFQKRYRKHKKKQLYLPVSISKILLVFAFSTVFRVNNDFTREVWKSSDLLLQKVIDPSESNARPLKL